MDSRLILICLTLVLGACSTPQFRSAQNGPTAQVAFSSAMLGDPAMIVELECKTFQITHNMVDKRKPTAPAQKILDLPAGKPVVLFYRYTEIDEHKKKAPITHGDRHSGRYRTYLEDQFAPHVCEKRIAFIPQEDQRYEVYFGATTTHNCLIFVKQVMNSYQSKNKKLNEVKLVPPPNCP